MKVWFDTQTTDEFGRPNFIQLSDEELRLVKRDSEALKRLLFIPTEREERAVDRDMSMGVENV